jgi:6,7-dimethyl-8-ribityllumazine synthase
LKPATSSTALPAGRGRRFAIVASRFHGEIVDRLVDGAVETFSNAGVRAKDLQVVRVPGAWEVPQGLEIVLRAGRWDGMVALGTLIRGETMHFEIIARECAHGIAALSLRSGVPIGFGILTCDTMEQAQARSGGAVGNQGGDAAAAVLAMAELAANGRQRKAAERKAKGMARR